MSHDLQYALGITLLCAALLLSAVMGLWQEGTYRRYGAVWREGLFYSVGSGEAGVISCI
jgi:UDP-xylose/UDP-N-acetylglucosamine transporter B4